MCCCWSRDAEGRAPPVGFEALNASHALAYIGAGRKLDGAQLGLAHCYQENPPVCTHASEQLSVMHITDNCSLLSRKSSGVYTEQLYPLCTCTFLSTLRCLGALARLLSMMQHVCSHACQRSRTARKFPRRSCYASLFLLAYFACSLVPPTPPPHPYSTPLYLHSLLLASSPPVLAQHGTQQTPISAEEAVADRIHVPQIPGTACTAPRPAHRRPKLLPAAPPRTQSACHTGYAGCSCKTVGGFTATGHGR